MDADAEAEDMRSITKQKGYPLIEGMITRNLNREVSPFSITRDTD